MNEEQEIRSTIREFVMRLFPTARRIPLEDSTSLVESGIVDSMGVLELATFIESEFSIVLTDDEVVSDHFDSINTLVNFVMSRAELGAET